MAEREELATGRRLATEHVLRDQPVHEDDRQVARREDVGDLHGRLVSHVPRDDEERHEKQGFLPGCDDVERRSAHAQFPQLRHRDVVQDEPDDEDADRDRGEAACANRRSPPT